MGFFALPWPGGFDRAGRLWDTGFARGQGTPWLVALVRLDSAFLPTDTVRAPTLPASDAIVFTRSDGSRPGACGRLSGVIVS